ncbi:MAG: hypothetical protein WCT08_03700 [Patescibacteria group bacterium]|jgi:hypothetical protein
MKMIAQLNSSDVETPEEWDKLVKLTVGSLNALTPLPVRLVQTEQATSTVIYEIVGGTEGDVAKLKQSLSLCQAH